MTDRMAALRPSELRLAPPPPKTPVQLSGSEPSLIARLVRLRLTGRLTPQAKGLLLREFCEARGGLWVKLAQILALRRDLFDTAFCNELSEILDRGPQVPFADVRRVIEEDLGEPLAAVFESFDEKPIAAASTGQTHRAKLLGGRDVAVKVQRPGLEEAVRKDLQDIERFIRFYGRSLLGLDISWDDVRWEIDLALAESLDYRLESTYMVRLRKRLLRHKVLVPRVITRFVHKRVHVKEWVTGVNVATFMRAKKEAPDELRRWLLENNIDPEKVGRRVFSSIMRQIFEENYYHGFWHPGNLLLLKHGWVAILDFWAMTSLENSFRRKYALFNQAIFDCEYTKAADLLLLLCPALPSTVEPEAIRDRVVNVLRTFEVRTFTRGLAFQEKSFSSAIGDILKALTDAGVPASWAFMRLDRAFLMIDRSLAQLMPDANVLEIGRRYWLKARRRALRRFSDPTLRARGLASFLNVLAEGPDFLAERMLFQGEAARRGAKAFKRTTSKIASLLAVVAGGMASLVLATTILGGLAFLAQHHPGAVAPIRGVLTYVDPLPQVDYLIWVLGLALLGRTYVKLRSLRGRLARAEAGTDGAM
jgi:ubiquinone biosynthesis protein